MKAGSAATRKIRSKINTFHSQTLFTSQLRPSLAAYNSFYSPVVLLFVWPGSLGLPALEGSLVFAQEVLEAGDVRGVLVPLAVVDEARRPSCPAASVPWQLPVGR